MLILRDAYKGMTRFDEFERSLGIAPNILTARLKALVADGLFERHLYSERPPRHEYWLTEAGRDARTIAFALLAWGNRHVAVDGTSMVVVDGDTGVAAEPTMVDRITGRPLSDPAFRIEARVTESRSMPKPHAASSKRRTSSGRRVGSAGREE